MTGRVQNKYAVNMQKLKKKAFLKRNEKLTQSN